ncbi:MAG: hypothetical protein ACREH5_03605 [Candidatus Omnitrophota bacterium]
MTAMKLPIEEFMEFWSERSAREKIMLVSLLVCFIVFMDYLLFIRPVQAIFADTLPRLGSLKNELRGLRLDKKNKEGIEKDWADAKVKLEAAESRFIRWDELSIAMDQASELAHSSGVKIISLVPVQSRKGDAPAGLYTPVPILINGVGGTHAIGKFLTKLETSRIFCRVMAVRIAENPSDAKRHLFELQLIVMQRAGAPR